MSIIQDIENHSVTLVSALDYLDKHNKHIIDINGYSLLSNSEKRLFRAVVKNYWSEMSMEQKIEVFIDGDDGELYYFVRKGWFTLDEFIEIFWAYDRELKEALSYTELFLLNAKCPVDREFANKWWLNIAEGAWSMNDKRESVVNASLHIPNTILKEKIAFVCKTGKRRGVGSNEGADRLIKSFKKFMLSPIERSKYSSQEVEEYVNIMRDHYCLSNMEVMLNLIE